MLESQQSVRFDEPTVGGPAKVSKPDCSQQELTQRAGAKLRKVLVTKSSTRVRRVGQS